MIDTQNMDLKKNVVNYKEEVIKKIQESVRIKSVMEPPKENMPFGEGPAKALEYFYNLGKELGFSVKNYDNYAITIELGEGEETLGILGHVDVVPEGENWDYPPYSGELVDGRIYGRGTLDDKGPSVIALYAMKCLLDSGIKLDKKIQLILGANEENGSKCMDYYFNTLKRPQPTIAFTPDSSFPVTFAEKGILGVKLKNSYETLDKVVIKGGNAFNSVPEKVELLAPKSYFVDLEKNFEKYNLEREYKIEIQSENENYKVVATGKSAHGSTPYKGYNAVSNLFQFLSRVIIKNDELKELVRFYNDKINMEYDGTRFGINFSDRESGKLSLNVGMIKLENNKLEICVDIRCPVLVELDTVIEIMKKNVNSKMELEVYSQTKPLYVEKDSFLVSTLMKVYQECTGDYQSRPLAIGGGTYARCVDNGVAFGALLSSQVDNMHQRNEYIEVDKLDTLLEIYVEAIYQLAK